MYGLRPSLFLYYPSQSARPVASKQCLLSKLFIAPGLNQPRVRLGTLLLCGNEESTEYKCKLVKH